MTCFQILVLSPEDLPDILGMTHVNPTLKDRRWFAVEAAGYEDDIRANSRGRKMASDISLTTLAFLGNTNNEVLQHNLRDNYLSEAFKNEDIKGTIYEEYLAYEAVMKLHKAFHKPNSNINFSSSVNALFGLKDKALKKEEMFAAMFLIPDGADEVYLIPKLKWLVEGVLTVSNSSVSYEEVATSPLTRSEIETIHNDRRHNCPDPTIAVKILGNLFLPSTTLNYSLETFPAAVILPVGEGVGVTLHCAAALHTFTCRATAGADRGLACITRIR